MKKAFADLGLHGNKIRESLSANIAENSYYEVTRSSNLVSNETWWTSAAKIQKIREINYTRSGSLVTSVETKQYNSAGLLVRTFTEAYVRSGNLIANITGVEA